MYKKFSYYLTIATSLIGAYPALAYNNILEGIDIDGTTVITEDDVGDLYQQFLSRQIDDNDLKNMQLLINSLYVKKGFPFVKVNVEVNDDGSNVNIKVVEGFLKKIIWKGEEEPDYLVQQLIDKYTTNNDRPFNLNEFQSSLININSMGTRKISAVLDKFKDENGIEVEGAFVINLIEEKAKNGVFNVTLDNNASKQLGRNELTTSVKFNDIITKNEKIFLAYTKSLTNNDVNAVSGSYEKMINFNGTSIEYSFNAGTQYPIGILSDLDFVNEANSHNFGINHLIYKDNNQFLYGNIDFSVKDLETRMLGSKLYFDKIRTLSAGLSGENVDSFKGKNNYSVEYVRGLDVLNASEATSDLSSNTGAKQEFNKLKLQLSRTQFLPYNFSLYSKIKGQLTGDSLLLPEKFTMGGIDCGRGYNPSEFSGDQGYCLTNELRYTYKTGINDFIIQPFIHFDNGKVHDTKTTSGIKPTLTASSYGGGSKFNLPLNFNGMLVTSKPVSRKYNGTQKIKRPKLTFMFGYTYEF